MIDDAVNSDAPGPEVKLELSDLRQRVLSGVFWLSSATAAQVVLRLIVVGILARLLVPADFGLIGAAGVFIALAELVSISGIVDAVAQRRNLDPRYVETALTVSLVSGLLTGTVAWLGAGSIAILFRMPSLEPILSALALLFPLNSISALSRKLLEREFAYKRLAAVETGSYFFGYALVGVALGLLGFGVWSLIFAQLASSAVRMLGLAGSQPYLLRPSFSWSCYVTLMRRGVGYSLVRNLIFFAQKGDYFIVGRSLGATALGFYERAYVLMEISNSLITNVVDRVLFQTFAKLQDDKVGLAAAFERISALLALIFIPAGVTASILAPEIVYVLLGTKWSGAVDPFRILALGMFFRTGFKVSTIVGNGLGVPYSNAKYLFVYAVMVVVGALITVGFGVTAVAAAVLLSLATAYFLLTRLSLRLTGMGWRPLVRAYLPAFRLTGVMILVMAAAAVPLRHFEVGPIVTLAVCGASAAVVLLLLMRLMPNFFGPHGQWAITALLQQLPHRRLQSGVRNRTSRD